MTLDEAKRRCRLGSERDGLRYDILTDGEECWVRKMDPRLDWNRHSGAFTGMRLVTSVRVNREVSDETER